MRIGINLVNNIIDNKFTYLIYEYDCFKFDKGNIVLFSLINNKTMQYKQ